MTKEWIHQKIPAQLHGLVIKAVQSKTDKIERIDK